MRYHLYCDESGQQSRGEYFVVAVVCLHTPDQDEVRSMVLDAERQSTRVGRKWSKSNLSQKERFLAAVDPILARCSSLAFRAHGSGLDYVRWTAETVAAAANAQDLEGEFHIVIDGQTDKESIRQILRAGAVDIRKIKGGRDQSEPLLRLADFAAGFVGEHIRGKPYVEAHWEQIGRHFTEV